MSDFELLTKEVVELTSGVRRDTDDGKMQPILCFDGPMFERWAILLTKGVSARGKRNWMNASTPEDLERFRESFVRHAVQWLRGDTDEDHAAAMIFNINGAEYTKEKLNEAVPSGTDAGVRGV